MIWMLLQKREREENAPVSLSLSLTSIELKRAAYTRTKKISTYFVDNV